MFTKKASAGFELGPHRQNSQRLEKMSMNPMNEFNNNKQHSKTRQHFFLFFGPWRPDVVISELNTEFLVKSCMFCQLEMSRILKFGPVPGYPGVPEGTRGYP